MSFLSSIISSYFHLYAFIALGANLNSSIGTPKDSISYATSLLAKYSDVPLLISSLHETEPLDCPPGSPNFTNGVLGLIPRLEETPLSLLKKLQAIENTVGRTRSGLVNEARVLDLDLITFKDETSATDILTLPHPRAHVRKFVLEPLRELTANAVFPGQKLSIDELINKLEPV